MHRMNKVAGFGIGGVGLLIVAIFVITIGWLVVKGGTTLTGADQEAAEEAARTWASDLGIELKGVSCAKMDSDGDGYVSCTVRDGREQIHQIECTGLVTINSGCRQPKFRTNQP